MDASPEVLFKLLCEVRDDVKELNEKIARREGICATHKAKIEMLEQNSKNVMDTTKTIVLMVVSAVTNFVLGWIVKGGKL